MPELNFELSMEQEFELKKLTQAASNMSREELLDALSTQIKLYFVQSNLIKSFIKQELSGGF